MNFKTVIVLLLFPVLLVAQENKCTVVNTSFQSGEKLTYRISYNWFVVFAEVGDVTFTINEVEKFGQKAFHFVGDGRSNSWWDKFFEVRDIYETYVDTKNLRPLYFQRKIKEGKFRQYVNYVFDKSDTLAYSKYRVNDDPLKIDTIKTSPCTYDVMSSLLYARNIDYSNIKEGEKIPLTILLDRKLYDLYFRYRGTEIVKLKGVGEFECIHFSVMVIEGNMFHEGEHLNLWVTNDRNHIPIYIESPIQIGNVKVRLTSWEGLKYPFDAKVK